VKTQIFEDSLLESLRDLETKIPAFISFISRVLMRRCAEPLVSVKGIPGQYRMTNKEAPTKASAFVSSILVPYSGFHQAAHRTMGPGPSKELETQVVMTLLSRYSGLVTELLNTIRKAEDSLLRLKTKRKGLKATPDSSQGAAAAAEPKATLTDEDKIRLQLLLDVEEFGAELRALGVDVANLEPFQTLIEVVRQAEKEKAKADGEDKALENPVAAS